MTEIVEFLEGTEIELYDEAKAEITMTNPENDWSDKETNMIGDDE